MVSHINFSQWETVTWPRERQDRWSKLENNHQMSTDKRSKREDIHICRQYIKHKIKVLWLENCFLNSIMIRPRYFLYRTQSGAAKVVCTFSGFRMKLSIRRSVFWSDILAAKTLFATVLQQQRSNKLDVVTQHVRSFIYFLHTQHPLIVKIPETWMNLTQHAAVSQYRPAPLELYTSSNPLQVIIHKCNLDLIGGKFVIPLW